MYVYANVAQIETSTIIDASWQELSGILPYTATPPVLGVRPSPPTTRHRRRPPWWTEGQSSGWYQLPIQGAGKDKKNRRLSFQLTFPWARRDNLQDLWFLGIVWNWKIVVSPKMLPALNSQSLMNCGYQLGEGNGGPLRTGWNPWQRSSVRKKCQTCCWPVVYCTLRQGSQVMYQACGFFVQHKTTRSALTPTQSQLGEVFPMHLDVCNFVDVILAVILPPVSSLGPSGSFKSCQLYVLDLRINQNSAWRFPKSWV